MIEIIPNVLPIFVHFTVALITLSGIFFILARLVGDRMFGTELLISARFTLWAGGLFTIATITAGFIAYYSVVHDTPSHIAMTIHRNWAIATLFFLLGYIGWSLVHAIRNTKPTVPFLFTTVFVLLMVSSTAWHGGELVYRYGIGVMSLPQAEKPGHDHADNQDNLSLNKAGGHGNHKHEVE